MKIQHINGRSIALALGVLMLLGTPLLPARAQDAGADNGKPVSLNLLNVPVGTALRTLFGSAGVRNFTIAPDVQGNVNINVSDVPFSLALGQLLNSLNPPAVFEVDNGTYTVKLKSAVTPPATTVIPPATTTIADGTSSDTASSNEPKKFWPPIPINQYDAYYIASLVGAQGIVEVMPNYPATTGSGGQGGQGGQNGGSRGGFGGGLNSPGISLGGGGFGGGGLGGGGFGGSSFGGGGFGGGGFGGGGYGR